MSTTTFPHELAFLHVALPIRFTQGIVVQRASMNGVDGIATNVPLIQHASETGYDFGHDSPGARDLALAAMHGVLVRMDISGPMAKLKDGSRVLQLAMELSAGFQTRFVEPAAGDELLITWNQALGWTRSTLLRYVREHDKTQAVLLDALQRMQDDLPRPLPDTELEMAALNRQLRDGATQLLGDASVLSQFLGMIA